MEHPQNECFNIAVVKSTKQSKLAFAGQSVGLLGLLGRWLSVLSYDDVKV
jgi:hypothetical protein